MATARRSAPVQEEKPNADQSGEPILSTADLLNLGAGSSTTVAISGVKNARVREVATEVAERVSKIVGMSEAEKDQTRVSILNAQLEALREALPGEEKDIAELIASLDQSLIGMDDDFMKLQEFTPEEQRGIDRAAEAHQSATVRFQTAEAALERVKNAVFFRGTRIAAAQAERTAAELEVKVTLDRQIEAKKIASRTRSRRLQGASIKESFARVEKNVQHTQRVLMERRQMTQKQYELNHTAKTTAYANKQAAAKAMEAATKDMERLQAKFTLESQQCQAIPAGTEARVKKEAEVSQIQRDLEQAKSAHDRAVVLYQDLEKATRKLELDEASLRGGIHSLDVMLADLTANSEIWKTEFETRLVQIKDTATQEATAELLQVGSLARQKNALASGQFLVASLEKLTTLAENSPAEIANLQTVRDATAEAVAGIAKRWEKITADAKKSADSGGSSAV